MKAVVIISSIFFLLGLKLSSIIDLRSKAEAVDTLITTKITQVKPLKAISLFKDSETVVEKKEGTEKQETTKQPKPEEVN
ncbi:MAG: hypothetical protein ACP5D9_09730 [Mariniphaga sp.]